MQLPAPFSERMQSQLGEDFMAFEAALASETPVSIRLNAAKISGEPNLEKVPWSRAGYYLPERPLFSLDPRWHAGAYYVQEASSQFLEQALTQHVPNYSILALDLCGAPGGKSTHIASVLPEGSFLVSNEVIRSRSQILAENMQKWGFANSLVTNNDPRDFNRLPGLFDLIIVDAPCSGEGLFRRDAAACEEWSPANVQLCSERQRRILADIWPSLKPGGILVYSTCTYNRAENEDNVAWLSAQEDLQSLPLKLQDNWGVVESVENGLYGYRFYPHKITGEGFFLSVLRKGGESSSKPPKVKRPKLSPVTKAIEPELQSWLLGKNWTFLQESERIYAVEREWEKAVQLLLSALRPVALGIPLAEQKSKNLIPQPPLALSPHINPEAFPSVEVDRRTALQFLHKDDIPLPDNTPEGWVLVKYKGLGLGWLKVMRNRSNNYWPTNWRLRQAIPEELGGEVVS
jgi:16S rRNA C967 or C1407 C5-methylase (RsmB/RsmF family)/NOL1/NOP2/fmu family ribosome biogenesis protein